MTIILPIPDRQCSQNARTGNSRVAAVLKSKTIKAHREHAKLITLSIINSLKDTLPRPIGYSLAHFFKYPHWVRDEDNADGGCKAYRDGICDAFRIDDKHFTKQKLSTRAIDKEKERVEITLYF